MRDCEVYMGLTVRCCIEGTFHQMFLHRRTRSLSIVMEQQQALRQLTVVQTLSFQHVSCNSLIITLGHQFLDALAVIFLAGGIQLTIESKVLYVVKVLLLKVSRRHVVRSIYKGKHILEHTAGSTRSGYELHHFLAHGLVLLPGIHTGFSRCFVRSYYTLADSGGGLQFQKRETSLELSQLHLNLLLRDSFLSQLFQVLLC